MPFRGGPRTTTAQVPARQSPAPITRPYRRSEGNVGDGSASEYRPHTAPSHVPASEPLEVAIGPCRVPPVQLSMTWRAQRHQRVSGSYPTGQRYVEWCRTTSSVDPRRGLGVGESHAASDSALRRAVRGFRMGVRRGTAVIAATAASWLGGASRCQRSLVSSTHRPCSTRSLAAPPWQRHRGQDDRPLRGRADATGMRPCGWSLVAAVDNACIRGRHRGLQ